MENAEALPDDKCMVCGQARDMHGDLNHRFSSDGRLIATEQPQRGMKEPPRVQAEHATREELISYMSQDIQAQSVMRLTEVLLEKGILNGKDTMYIFSGFKASDDNV